MSGGQISVVIPTYNRTRFLEEAVASILAQTRPAAEILIVDDGSGAAFQTDLRRIADLNPIIELRALPTNKGVSSARNFGLEHAHGDYILFLDDDDLVPPDFFSEAIRELEADASLAGVVVSYHRPTVHANGGALFDYRREGDRLQRDALGVFLLSCPPIHSVLLRRRMIDTARFPEHLEIGEDWHFWLTLASNGCQFKFRGDISVYYRLHAQSVSNSRRFTPAMVPVIRQVANSDLIRCRHARFAMTAKLFRALLRLGDPRAAWHFVRLLAYPTLSSLYFGLYVARRLRTLSAQSWRPQNS